MNENEITVKGYTVLKQNENSNMVGLNIRNKDEIEKMKKMGIGKEYDGNYYVWFVGNGYTFVPSKKYELTVKKIENSKFYKITNINNMILDIENMSEEESFLKLNEIRIRTAGAGKKPVYRAVNETAKGLIEKYCPNIVIDALNGKKEEVLANLEKKDREIKKAKKLKTKLKAKKKLTKEEKKKLEEIEEIAKEKNLTTLINNFDNICSAIFNCFLPSTLKKELEEYDLTIEECLKLVSKYQDIKTIKGELMKNPYKFLCDGLKKSFFTVDDKILKAYPSFVNSEQRYISSLDTSIKTLKQMTCNTIFKREDIEDYILKENKKHNIQSYNFDTLDGIISDIKNRGCIYKFYENEQEWITSEKNFDDERRIRRYFMNNDVSKKDVDLSCFKILKDGKATDEQLSVLSSVAKNKLTIVDAGGGTGKTATLKAVIDMCKMCGMNYLLLAPTGRVAKRMEELTTDSEAMTIDRLWYTIKATGEEYVHKNTLIVVEEGSMLSIELFNKVLDIVGNADNVRFLINLDLKQLPPIGAGCPIRDMIYNIDKMKGAEVKELTKVFRYDEGGIAQKCADARKGYSLYLDMLDNPMSRYSRCGSDFALIRANNYMITEQVKKEYEVALKTLELQGLTHEQAIEKITIIAPMRKGEHGTLVLNNILQEIANKKTSESKEIEILTDKDNNVKTIYRTKDRVMNTENNYKVPTLYGYELYKSGEISKEDIANTRYNPKEPDSQQYAVPCFNGSFGTIVDVDAENKVVYVKFEDVVLVFEKMQILKLALAYAVTCHKLQGSENNYIISVFTDYAAHMCNQNMIYTTISRSKKFFVGIWNEMLIENKITEEEIIKRDTILNFLLKSEYSLQDIMTNQKF